MKQKSTKNVNFQPTENLVEISSVSDSEEDMLLMSGPPKVIPKKGSDGIVAECWSKSDDTSQYEDVSEQDYPDEP